MYLQFLKLTRGKIRNREIEKINFRNPFREMKRKKLEIARKRMTAKKLIENLRERKRRKNFELVSYDVEWKRRISILILLVSL